ncbi:hypothetical protein B7494_g3178 [Chlorociboria aeruginascens]|nr:hypothetical protein B7494_g3178 [Chlorociboria aeruginascens]
MTALALAASMEPPQTQNTAPVLEFRCLWTSDIRRKQKRWQDGRLKFHTFNKRVMVYDERSNFVGDTHWREDSDFGEGEELELERSGILLEVGECIGKKEQDLTELIDKRVKDREERVAAKTASLTPLRPQVVRLQGNPTPAGAPHLRSKSLNTLLGTPTGHYGKAVLSTTSPFDERQLLNNIAQGENDRPAKRRKPNEPAPSKSGYAQNLMGATLRFSSRPPSTATIRYEPLRVTSSTLQKVSIDLTEGDDESQEMSVRSTVRDANARGDDHMKNRMHKRTSEKSPRRRYAGNLTGAALSLAKPHTGPSKPINNSTTVYKTPSRSRQVDMAPSSSNEERVISNGQSQKTVENPKHNSKRDQGCSIEVSVSHLNLSPPTPDHRASKSSAASEQPIVTKVAALQRIDDQPHSVLRIKSRPPRKMMMLMNRPSSRAPAFDDVKNPNQRNAERPRRLNSGSFSDIKTLAHQPGAVNRGAGAASNQNGSNVEDFPSSLSDSGIDHQITNALLSRKHIAAQEAKRRVKEASFARKKTLPAPHNEDIGLDIAEKSNITVQATTGKSKSSPVTEAGTPLDISTEDFSEKSQETVPANPEQLVRNTQPKTKQTSPAIVRQVQVDLSTEMRLTQQESEWNDTSSIDKLDAIVNRGSQCPGVEGPSTTEIQRPVADSIQNPNVLPQHVIDAFSSAREHYQIDRGARTTISELQGRHENQSCVIHNQPELEPASSGPTIKPSPKSSPHLFHSSSTRVKDMDVVGFVSANEINGPGEVNQISVPRLTAPNLPSATFKLSSPAQGQSMQMTMHTTAHGNAMPSPSLPRSLIEKATSSGGPWSRESFDLFGAWKPPGTNTNHGS